MGLEISNFIRRDQFYEARCDIAAALMLVVFLYMFHHSISQSPHTLTCVVCVSGRVLYDRAEQGSGMDTKKTHITICTHK